MVIFFDEIPEAKREIFSQRNKMSLTQILLIHISFLALLFLALGSYSHILHFLPASITNSHDLGDAYTSVADLIFFFGAILLLAWEKAWLSSRMTQSENAEK
jgi:hypothetical protein